MKEETKQSNGRPSLYTDDKHFEAIQYIESGYIDLEHAFPSVAGMSIAITIAKSTLYKWVEDKREGEHGKFSDTLENCKTHQELITLNKSLKGEFNPTISKLVLANHGYSEKQDLAISGEGISFNLNFGKHAD